MRPSVPLLGSAIDTARASARDTAGELVRWSVNRIMPDGGQRTARQNAWAAMGAEARHARDRREAEAALRRAAARAAHPAGGPRDGRPAEDVAPGAAGVVFSV